MNALLPAWCLPVGHRRYPRCLEALESGRRPTLHGVGDPAALSDLDRDAAVTIVGSRNASGYGLRAAERLGHDLAAAGVTVVSGMARGIDGAAHRGALAGGGRTIAVLAGGPDIAYPRSHVELYGRIVASGAAVSEHPPGTLAARYQFAARNRIMAAFGEVVVIVEAALPSGSMITADLAAGMGRTVGALPGPVGVRVAEGPNALLKEGAHVIRDATDVLDLLHGVGAASAPGGDRSKPGHRAGPALDAGLVAALEAVEGGARTVDRVAAEAALAPRDAAVALTRLERLGYVGARPSGEFERSALRAPPTG